TLESWVHEVAALTQPDKLHWCSGNQAEYDELCSQMVADGTMVRLDPAKHPGSYYARSDRRDVARVEDRTFICSPTAEDAGPTNNWAEPTAMHAKLQQILAGCMRGRT